MPPSGCGGRRDGSVLAFRDDIGLSARPIVLCVAGEASGDALLAPVVDAIRALGCDAIGVGGDASAARGLHLLGHARDVAGHGIVEAIGTLPALGQAWIALNRWLPRAKALVLVDFPELNLRLLRRAHRRGIPAIYLAPPQAWAWRPHRAASLARARRVACLLPFEAEWYRAHGIAAECVGHPLAERAPLPSADGMGLALLPGSRDPTVRRLFPMQLATAARLVRRFAGLSVHVGVAETIDRAFVERAFAAASLPGAVHTSADAALAASTVALAGAGTATLHAVLTGRPVVTMAALHPLSAVIARRLVKVEHVALPNLVLGRRAFAECVLGACHPAPLADALDGMLRAPERWQPAIAEVRARVRRPDGMARVAGWVREVVAG